MSNIENENDFIEIEEETYPIDEFELTTTPNDFNTLTLISFIRSKVFKIPSFQRHFVWDIKKSSKLIESLLIGLPIPQIFLYEKGKNEFLVIDGQQRLMSLYYFFSGRFPKHEKRSELRKIFDEHGFIPPEILSNDDYFNKFNLRLDGIADGQSNKFDGKNYETLGESQTTLNLATIRNMVIKPVAQDSEDGAMFEIFNRLNSGGVNLAPQEIRMSLYHSEFLELLVKLNEHPKWRLILAKKIIDVRLNDVEALLRSFAMAIYLDKYKSSVNGFLNNFSNFAKTFSPEKINLCESIWNAFMDACQDLSEEHFRTGGSRLSITLFESVFSASIEESLATGKISVKKIPTDYIERLKSDELFIRYSTGKTTRGESVRGRIARAKDILKEF
ncbi:DUF262 domain-containing protein [Salmonella enterica]|nr:DUF262 domain-containing protein [Salmonella enterica]EHA8581147.1 DUF262 domain-containing protein [Salmonella enterica]